MKRRITLAQAPGSQFEQQQAVLSSNSLAIRGLDAARQERITLDLDDLPEEVRQNMKALPQHIKLTVFV